MKLQELTIKRERWGDDEGKYTGLVRFDSDKGDIGIKMSQEVTESFLALAGDLIIAHVEVAGKELQNSIDIAVDRAKLNIRLPEEIARLHAKDAKLIEEQE